MKSADQLWRELAGPERTARRPDFRVDPDFRPADKSGAAQGHRTLYSELREKAPHIDAGLAALITHPDLKALVAAGDPDALHLAFELIQLGAPVDVAVADFSMQAYLDWHPDIARARMNPLMHYLRYATVERRHRALADLRRDLHLGAQPFLPERETVLICVHELSRTGAPVVGLDLAREASLGFNTIVATHQAGPLLDEFLPHCCAVQVLKNPLRELPYVPFPAFRQIDRAILNSVESVLFVHPLVAENIPFAVYIHEYADNTEAWKMACVTTFADLLVFGSDHVRGSWRGRFDDVRFDAKTDSTVIPQQALVEGTVTAARRTAARQELSRVLKRDLADARLICGAGKIQIRKGTDIFVQAAQIAAGIDPDAVFVWIGDGQNHQDPHFGVYLDLQMRQVGAGRPEGNLFFLPAGPLYPVLLDAADAMFLSSRLDPLPNVVFDALRHGASVVCFDGATGFSDGRYRNSPRIRCTPYLDPAAAVRALLDLPRKADGPDVAAEGPPPEPSVFLRLDRALRDRLARQRSFVRGESAIDSPLLFTTSKADRTLRQREREKMLSYGRRLLWRDIEDARAALAASGSWMHRRMRVETYAEVPADDPRLPRFSIHVHAYHTDDLKADFRDHAAFARAGRIVVTTDTPAKAEQAREAAAAHGLRIETLIMPNQGRDILPFLRLFGAGGAAGEDDIWCHLHQKKSLQTTRRGDVWKRFLHRICLGSDRALSSALLSIAEPGTGLVAPFDPYVVGWNDSQRSLGRIAGAFPGPFPPAPLLFPVGNMFWTRAAVVREMLALFGEDHPWPNEPIPTDGTEFHLIERLWPAIAARMGLASVFLHKPDEARV